MRMFIKLYLVVWPCYKNGWKWILMFHGLSGTKLLLKLKIQVCMDVCTYMLTHACNKAIHLCINMSVHKVATRAHRYIYIYIHNFNCINECSITFMC